MKQTLQKVSKISHGKQNTTKQEILNLRAVNLIHTGTYFTLVLLETRNLLVRMFNFCHNDFLYKVFTRLLYNDTMK